MKMNYSEMIQWLHDYAEGPMAHNPEHAHVCNALTEIRVELERLRAIVDRLQPAIVLTYSDGKYFDRYVPAPGTAGYALWRYSEDFDLRVSPCRTPEDFDEAATGHVWIIEDCEDDCEVLGVYSTKEAAEKARGT